VQQSSEHVEQRWRHRFGFTVAYAAAEHRNRSMFAFSAAEAQQIMARP